MKQDSVKSFFDADDDSMLFCGMAIGYGNHDAKVNQLRSTRSPIDDWATFF